jgi:signal transduction histidine kinase
MLQTFLAGKVPPDQAPMLYGMGLKESDRLEHMLENVLLSGRLRSRQHELTPEPIPLRSLLKAFVEHRRQTLVGQPDEIRLAWDPEPDELLVSADRQALQVVLENLCDNAMKYGGDPAVATVRASKENGRVSVSVEDDGIGFEPDQAAKLFEPFRRGLEGRSEVQHGTGLGLAISAALVHRMGGTLTAFSEGPGLGSRFTITLTEAKP